MHQLVSASLGASALCLALVDLVDLDHLDHLDPLEAILLAAEAPGPGNGIQVLVTFSVCFKGYPMYPMYPMYPIYPVSKWLPKQFKKKLADGVGEDFCKTLWKTEWSPCWNANHWFIFRQRLRTGLVPNGPHPRLLCYLKRSTLGSLVTTQGEILGGKGLPGPNGMGGKPQNPNSGLLY